MQILRKNQDLNLVLNHETDFQTNLGWQENLAQLEDEILGDIINPTENYETVRFIHEPYDSTNNLSENVVEQTDIWFYFYFLNNGTYNNGLDYNRIGITTRENAKMLRQSTESFFRLEFFKTPHILDENGSIIEYEAPNRINRKLVFAKNLSLPLGEKVFYTGENFNEYIHVPVFMGSNYKNKENMYFFWFQDESVLTETTLSGTTTLDKYTFVNTGTAKTTPFLNSNNLLTNINIPNGTTVFSGQTNQMFDIPEVTVTYDRNFYPGTNTFFMTAKFFNATDGSIVDFTNDAFSASYTATGITESTDMYYQVDINKLDYSYKVYFFNGTKSVDRYGRTCLPIQFYERGGGTFTKPTYDCTSFVPPPTPNPTLTPTPTISLTPTPTPTPTPAGNGGGNGGTEEPVYYYFKLKSCLEDPNSPTNVYWTYRSFLSTSMSYGNIFKSAGGFYYTIVDHSLTNQNGTIDGTKSVSPDPQSCSEVENYWQPPAPNRTINVSVFAPIEYKNASIVLTDVCGKNPSNILFGNGYTTAGVGWIDGTTISSNTTYQLYENSTAGSSTLFSGPNKYCGILISGQGSTFAYVAYINSTGNLSEWSTC